MGFCVSVMLVRLVVNSKLVFISIGWLLWWLMVWFVKGLSSVDMMSVIENVVNMVGVVIFRLCVMGVVSMVGR